MPRGAAPKSSLAQHRASGDERNRVLETQAALIQGLQCRRKSPMRYHSGFEVRYQLGPVRSENFETWARYAPRGPRADANWERSYGP